jgi:hypothetical protein
MRDAKSATGGAARTLDDILPPTPGFGDKLRAAPAWLTSAIIHMLLVIVLGLLLVPKEKTLELLLSLSANEPGEDLDAGAFDMDSTLSDQPLDESSTEDMTELVEATTVDETPVETAPVKPMGLTETTDAEPIRLALAGRRRGMKETLLKAFGGNGATESAVNEALKWLARNQKKAMWSLVGPYADGTARENPEAATALALLAFQGAGVTPDLDRDETPFAPNVAKAWNELLKRQEDNGNFFREGAGNAALYTHALCTIAVCELYGMTEDSRYREPAQRAVDYCAKIQSSEGGWRYAPGAGSDLSVTGWFVMALQSARMAGLEVPQETLDGVTRFLNTVSQDAGAQYSYLPGQAKKNSMTAEGLLCRQYLGWPRSDARLERGVAVLLESLPTNVSDQRDAYYWYYAAQVCHHMEGASWRKWNEAMREIVPDLQVRDGRERGSWNPSDDMGVGASGGGRLFITCLNCYMLEVYYRHLPLYRLEEQALQGTATGGGP